MRLVQEGKLKLDDPVSKYGVLLEGDGVIRVRHLLSHTSEGSPGERYRYNGNRFAELDKVVQRAGGKSFAELLIADVLEPLGMNDTAPNVPRMVGTRTPGAADAAAEGEVKAAVLEIMAGFTSGDVSRIERRLAPHHNVFQGEEGFLTSFIDAAELSRAFQSGFKLQFEVRELEAAVYGDTAAATFFVSGTSTPPGGAPRAGGPWRSSFVLNRHEGGWKLVHSHQSPINRTTITEKHRQRFDAGKNRQADVVITLPAGNYRLRYKSDDSHAFGRWNSLPPDINFWGIAVYKK
jgi:CubicO group peptidase (beta-lactamase class C family)